MAIIVTLITLTTLAAIIAVEAKGLLSTVVSVGAAGLFLSVIFLLLGAPDLAITQVVVEVLCLVLLIKAAGHREEATYEQPRDRFIIATGLVCCGILLAASILAFEALYGYGSPLMNLSNQYLAEGFEKTGAANYVMAVLLDFRAYDTLGEATVIFCSIIGVYAVIRKIGRTQHEGHDTHR